MLLQSPVASAVAVLALALGIGVNLTSFICVNSIVLHPFPFPRLERIMSVWEVPAKSQDERYPFAPANFLDWKQQSDIFEETAAFQPWDVNLTGTNDPTRVEASLVSPAFFTILGKQALLGRTFSKGEAPSANARTVVISNGFWRKHLAGSRDAIGKPISLGGETYTVIGVMPSDFDFPLSNQIWAPLRLTPEEERQRSNRSLQVLALLKPGVSVLRAQADAAKIAHRLQLQYPRTNEAVTFQVLPMRELVDEVTDRFLYVLMGCALFVLLLAAANVGNLQIARATTRLKEIAVRAALGASRFQVARQLMAEGILISAAGGICGLLLASWNVSLSKARIPAEVFALVPGLHAMHVDGTVVAYTLLVSVVTGILASLPAVFQLLRHGMRLDLNEALQKGGGRTASTSAGLNRLQSLLIGYEVAMALVLLVCAGFMVKAFNNILVGSYGYNPKNMLRLQVSLPQVQYSSDNRLVSFYDRVLHQFQTLPGAQAAAVWSEGPDLPLLVEGRPAPRPGDLTPEMTSISGDYLRSMSMPLLQGRSISDRDRQNTPRVALLSASVARHYWPHSDPIGHRIKLGASDSPWLTIVGVSGDIVDDWFTNRPADLVYVPYAQYPPRSTTFVIRTVGDPDQLARAARDGIRKFDQNLPIYAIKSMDRYMYEQTSGVRAAANTMTQYASVALLLAATGIFGVIAYFVAQRTRDIGIRIALGANTKDVLKVTLRRTMFPTFLGIVIGMAAAYGLAVFMASVLFNFVKLEPSTFLISAALLTATALLASYVPARRAARVDPLIALRDS